MLGLSLLASVSAHEVTVHKLQYDNQSGAVVTTDEPVGEATFRLYEVPEDSDATKIAEAIENEAPEKFAYEGAIDKNGVLTFKDVKPGSYVLVESKFSGKHAKSMFFKVDKDLNVYTKNSPHQPGIGNGGSTQTPTTQAPVVELPTTQGTTVEIPTTQSRPATPQKPTGETEPPVVRNQKELPKTGVVQGGMTMTLGILSAILGGLTAVGQKRKKYE